MAAQLPSASNNRSAVKEPDALDEEYKSLPLQTRIENQIYRRRRLIMLNGLVIKMVTVFVQWCVFVLNLLVKCAKVLENSRAGVVVAAHIEEYTSCKWRVRCREPR